MKTFNISTKRRMQIKTKHNNIFPLSIWQILQKIDANLCCWRCEWTHCWGLFRLVMRDKLWRKVILIAYPDMIFWIISPCLKCTNPLKSVVYFFVWKASIWKIIWGGLWKDWHYPGSLTSRGICVLTYLVGGLWVKDHERSTYECQSIKDLF